MSNFLLSLEENNFHADKAILFGSYASGKAKNLSDIDMAVWLQNFSGQHYTDIPGLLHIVSLHHPIKPKFYDTYDTAETDPFIEIIERTGKQILLPVRKTFLEENQLD